MASYVLLMWKLHMSSVPWVDDGSWSEGDPVSLFPMIVRFFVYFDLVFAMISSNVGDSEKPGPRSLLAQLLQRFIAAKHAGLVSRSLPLSWWTSCRTLVPKRFARGLMPP